MGKPARLVWISLASLVFFCFFCEAAEIKNIFVRPKVHVVITNFLPGGTTLTLHCKSKDDDLGSQSLGPGGVFRFSFRPRPFVKTTLFFCSFQWPGQFHYFDVYVQARDDDRCKHNCLWSIVPDGPCLFNLSNGLYDICSPWNPLSSRLPLLA